MGSDMIFIELCERILEKLITFVVSIDDPLFTLIRRAENIMCDTKSDVARVEIFSSELRRLADVQDQTNPISHEEDIVIRLLKMLVD